MTGFAQELADARQDIGFGLAREALRQVVSHWPGDLRGVSVKADDSQTPGYVIVTLLGAADGVLPLGRLIRFSVMELQCPVSSVVGERVRGVYREWMEGQR